MIVWIFAIFLWIYSLPLLVLMCFLFFSLFLIILPPFILFGLLQYFFTRENLAKLNYQWWFGKVPKVHLEKKFLVCFHPHGVLCTAAIVCIHLKNDTKFAVAPLLLYMPIIGLFAKNLGCIEATEEEICKHLKKHSVILCPGGIPELVLQRHYTRRIGFLRIAKKMNVPILPVVCKTNFYYVPRLPLESIRIHLAKLNIPILFFPLGWYGSFLPKRKNIQLEVFKPYFVESNRTLEEHRKKYYKILLDK